MPGYIRSLSAALTLLAAVTLQAQEVPFTGVIVEDDAELRAGAGATFYVVGTLKQGTLVTVDEVVFGWYKIVPPEGVHSYISKAFVNRQGDGKVGVINKDRATITAASVNGPGESYRRQGVDAMVGDKVQIVGESGDYYKILPPKGAYVFAPPGAVRRATAGEMQTEEVAAPQPVQVDEPDEAVVEPAPAVAEAADVEPATETDEADEVVEADTDAADGAEVELAAEEADADESPAAPQPVAVQEAPAGAADDLAGITDTQQLFRTAEGRIEGVFELPLEDQPVGPYLAAYERALASGDLTDAQAIIARSRVRQLQRTRELQKALAEVAQVRQRIDEQRRLISQARDEADVEPIYDATGQLVASSVYDGVNLPRLLRIVEPRTARTIVYVRPSPDRDLRPYIGQIVGVVGRPRFDPALKVRIIDAKRIDVLETRPAAQ